MQSQFLDITTGVNAEKKVHTIVGKFPKLVF